MSILTMYCQLECVIDFMIANIANEDKVVKLKNFLVLHEYLHKSIKSIKWPICKHFIQILKQANNLARLQASMLLFIDVSCDVCLHKTYKTSQNTGISPTSHRR